MAELKFKAPEEWMKQANYDFETAEAMFSAGRYIYTIYMCHLSLEKALKAHYAKKYEKDPPKTHNLNYLIENCEVNLSEDKLVFISKLNNVSIHTRYPDQIEKLVKEYKKTTTEEDLKRTNEILVWLEQNL